MSLPKWNTSLPQDPGWNGWYWLADMEKKTYVYAELDHHPEKVTSVIYFQVHIKASPSLLNTQMLYIYLHQEIGKIPAADST